MHFNFATLGLIATVVMSSVLASKHMDGVNDKVSAVSSTTAGDNINLAVAKRNYLSRRRVANVLQRRRIVCDHRNHKTYHRGDDHKHHFRPHRHRRHNHCGDSDGHHCDDFDVDDFDFDNDFIDGDYNDFDDDNYYECDECDACDDDDDFWSDFDDETT